MAVNNVPIVGKRVANFTEWIVSNNATSYDKIHMVGHSLGSHVSGEAGWNIQIQTNGSKIGRVTGIIKIRINLV